MDNLELLIAQIKKLLEEAISEKDNVLIRAVNVEEKIFTPPFFITNLKFEGDILTIPNLYDKSHFLITENNYKSWYFLKSTNIRTDKNELIYDYDIIGFVTHKKTIFGKKSWKIDKAPPPFIIRFQDFNSVPTISIVQPMVDQYLISGLFIQKRIDELKRIHGFEIFKVGNFAIPSKMNSDLFTIPNALTVEQALNYK